MLSCVFLLLTLVFSASSAWDIPCSNVPTVTNISLNELHGEWIAIETYNEENMIAVTSIICLLMNVVETNTTRMGIEMNGVYGTDEFPLQSNITYEDSQLEGKWEAKEIDDTWLIAVNTSSYFTYALCRKHPESSTLIVGGVTTWQRNNVTLSEEDLETAREAVRVALGVRDLKVLRYNTWCSRQ